MRLILFIAVTFILCSTAIADSHEHATHSEHNHEDSSRFLVEDSDLSKLGLTLGKIGAATVTDGIRVTGKIIPVDSKLAHVAARFAGVIKDVNVKVGDTIEAGSPLATVQNNQNLQTFTLFNANKGVVIDRHATLGENVAETEALFIVADLSEVLAELAIDRKDVAQVRVGQKVRVTVPSSSASQEGEISVVAPVTDETTQTTFARVKLTNPNNQFPPGAFIRATIITFETVVPSAIATDAIEEVNGEKTVFIREGDSFEPHQVTSGRFDEVMTELLGGVQNGEQYAYGNTDLLKLVLAEESEHSHEEESNHEDAHNHSDKHEHGEEEEEHGEEGHVKLSPEGIKNGGIEIETAGSATLQMKLKLNGEISPNVDRLAHITPRFPGIIKETRKNVGDTVDQGEVLAIVESNQSVQAYEIRAPMSGRILERHATIGEFTAASPIFVIGDLTEVWIDLIVPEESASRVKPGQTLLIGHAQDNQKILTGTVSFLSPVVDETTQSRFARAVIMNKEGHLLPGAFVSGELIIDDSSVPLAVKDAGVQNIDGRAVLFIEDKEGVFEKRDIILGREDGVYSEILKGLSAGERYIATNSFLLKAELGKSEAEHEH